jgi:hypothetical protein
VLDPLDRKTPRLACAMSEPDPTGRKPTARPNASSKSLREWIYAQPYRPSEERAKAMHPWIDACNTKRAHSTINRETFWQRLNNLLGNDS